MPNDSKAFVKSAVLESFCNFLGLKMGINRRDVVTWKPISKRFKDVINTVLLRHNGIFWS